MENKLNKDLNNIILIGMPGAGKSSIGVVAAKRLRMSFLDTDLVIQEKAQKTLRELIAERTVDGFLQMENEICCGIHAENCMIATGGSAVYGKSAMRHFKEIGRIVYLAVPLSDLAGRLGDLVERGVTHRPGQKLADIYRERTALYERYADMTLWQHGRHFPMDEMVEKLVRAAQNA